MLVDGKCVISLYIANSELRHVRKGKDSLDWGIGNAALASC